MMNKQFSFLAICILFNLSARSQDFEWSAESNIQQQINQLKENQRARGSFTEQLNLTGSNKGEIHRLDSIIYYGYDVELEEWNAKMFKISIFYDSYFNDTTILQSTWDKTSNSWMLRTKEVKQYDGNHRIKSRGFYLIPKSASRVEYTYNENSDLAEITESYLNSGQWHYKKRNVYSYNAENLLLADTLYHRFTISGSSAWYAVAYTNFHYDTEGSLMADTSYARSWLSGNNFGDWELNSRTEYEASENGRLSTSFIWKSESDNFKPNGKELILYHNNDINISALIDFEWNSGLDIWDTSTIIQYLYSKDDHIISYEKLTMDNSRSKVKEVFDYDYDIADNELLLPTSAIGANPKIAFHHKINTKYSFRYDYSTNENQKFRETKYYFSAIQDNTSTVVNERSQTAVLIYPNPASDLINIRFCDSFHEAWFELFDINGKKILSKAVTKGESLNISKLESGLYIYSIRDGKQRNIGKLLIK